MNTYFENYFQKLSKLTSDIKTKKLIEVAELISSKNLNGKKIIIAGNGGSASIASHISVDLIKSAKIRCLNFNEPNLITCFSNDFGYENWIKEALNIYASTNDIIILISSSGKSMNMINAAKKSKEIGMKLITFTGFNIDNPLRKYGDLNFWVDSKNYNYVEMTHHIWLVSIVDFIVEQKNE